MNILVTGANGQLGNEMRIVSKGSSDKYIFTDVVEVSEDSKAMLKKLAGDDINTETEHLDVTKLDAIRELVHKERIDAIINCAAYTNVDAAEDNYAMAELLNTKAVENLAWVMRETNGLFIHISTDYVFGGDPYNIPCKEDQKGTPTGVYGLTKLRGEEVIRKVGCRYVIIRTAWLYSEFGKNFVKTMLYLTATKPQLKVVFDQIGTPTYARDLAQAIVLILSKAETGIYHYSNEGVCSWYDFTKMIAEYAGNTNCDIQPCHSEEFPSKVKRPAFSVLDKSKIKETFGIKVPYWIDSLKACIKNITA
ncbi:MAG: dTDP-4-dehydrorhamnose reductase [Prevotella sp.]|nr:dTDP-4-dehydrorhamnose reductase [Prevotella sp.]